jgi:hypothetical protein
VTPPRFTEEELYYYQTNGNNMLIGIHGFNVGVGEFSKEFLGFKQESFPLKALDQLEHKSMYTPELSPSLCTVFRNRAILQMQFPDVPLEAFPQDDTCDTSHSVLNGSEAHLWLIHLEHNLNRASNQFDGSDYRRFTRLPLVIWDGDVGDLNYMASEPIADATGLALVPAIQQALEAGIQVSIFAHSMGCRVALKLLDSLGKAGSFHKIHRTFLWQAALPDTALSNDPTKDISYRQNCQFIHAMEAVEKMVVFYTQNDLVLKKWYELANEVYIEEANVTSIVLTEQEAHAKILPALGALGPDPETSAFYDSKLLSVNLSPWAFGHSYMKVPSDDIMKYAYQQVVLNPEKGLTQFGTYDPSLFRLRGEIYE